MRFAAGLLCVHSVIECVAVIQKRSCKHSSRCASGRCFKHQSAFSRVHRWPTHTN